MYVFLDKRFLDKNHNIVVGKFQLYGKIALKSNEYIYIHFLYFHSIYTYLIYSLNIYISLFKLHFKKQFSRISFPITVLIFYLKLFKISPLFSQMHFEDFGHNGFLLEKIGNI